MSVQSTIRSRAAAARAALSRGDTNHDGRLSAAEQRRAASKASGAARTAVQRSFAQARIRSGYVSVSKARGVISTAERNALKNGHQGPVSSALTSGLKSSSASKPTSVKGIRVTTTMKNLARNATSVANGMGGYRSQGLCATGVSRNIRRTMGLTVRGNGNQIDNNLPRRKFKQINISLKDALKIPGLVLTWERTSSAAGRKYGHTAVTLGNGRGSASDFIERNTLYAGGRSGLKIFMPI